MFVGRPHTVAETEELIARVKQARRECCGTDRALICAYDDELVELESVKAALIPEPRKPPIP